MRRYTLKEGWIQTFFLSLMCQHGSKCDIADALDVPNRCVELVIDDDPAFTIQLYTGCFNIQPFNIWSPADGHKDDVCFELSSEKVGDELHIVKTGVGWTNRFLFPILS